MDKILCCDFNTLCYFKRYNRKKYNDVICGDGGELFLESKWSSLISLQQDALDPLSWSHLASQQPPVTHCGCNLQLPAVNVCAQFFLNPWLITAVYGRKKK